LLLAGTRPVLLQKQISLQLSGTIHTTKWIGAAQQEDAAPMPLVSHEN
jgi:hypothetical protein